MLLAVVADSQAELPALGRTPVGLDEGAQLLFLLVHGAGLLHADAGNEGEELPVIGPVSSLEIGEAGEGVNAAGAGREGLKDIVGDVLHAAAELPLGRDVGDDVADLELLGFKLAGEESLTILADISHVHLGRVAAASAGELFRDPVQPELIHPVGAHGPVPLGGEGEGLAFLQGRGAVGPVEAGIVIAREGGTVDAELQGVILVHKPVNAAENGRLIVSYCIGLAPGDEGRIRR